MAPTAPPREVFVVVVMSYRTRETGVLSADEQGIPLFDGATWFVAAHPRQAKRLTRIAAGMVVSMLTSRVEGIRAWAAPETAYAERYSAIVN